MLYYNNVRRLCHNYLNSKVRRF